MFCALLMKRAFYRDHLLWPLCFARDYHWLR